MERGLLGVAVDPAFADQHYIYLYYTFKKRDLRHRSPDASTQPVNRVSRFLLGDNDLVDPASETVLIDNIPIADGIHNARRPAVRQGRLPLRQRRRRRLRLPGAAACGPGNDACRDQNVLLGKVLRITSDGGVPPGNPFVGRRHRALQRRRAHDSRSKCQETFAWGLRNPFRLAFDPNAPARASSSTTSGRTRGRRSISARRAPTTAGTCARARARPARRPTAAPAGRDDEPVYDYDHSAGCSSVTGGAFVPNGVWPAAYDGHYLYSRLVCRRSSISRPTEPGDITARSSAPACRQPLG